MNKDLNELKQKYAELGEEIKRLEEAPKPWPQDGDEIFILDTIGVVISGNFTKSNSFVTKALTQGNVFLTRAEAEAEKHYREVAYKLRQQEGAKKFIKYEMNYGLGFDAEVTKLNISCSRIFTGSHLNVYYDTDKQCRNAIAAVDKQEIIRAIRWKELGETS